MNVPLVAVLTLVTTAWMATVQPAVASPQTARTVANRPDPRQIPVPPIVGPMGRPPVGQPSAFRGRRTLEAGVADPGHTKAVPLLDLERETSDWLQETGPDPSKRYFMWISPGTHPQLPAGRQDDTHFVEAGAARVAELAVDGMRALRLPITALLK